jgi:acyl-CoA thioester hydrolase
MIELWRGTVNAWECDELGHMNVRFYLAKASQAIANLAEAAGLNPIHRHDASATLIARDIHIRFLAEAHPGAPVYIEGGILDHDATSATAMLVMRHAASGVPAASYRLVLGHASPKNGRDFAWPLRFPERAAQLRVERPDFAAPRGLSLDDTGATTASLERADALALTGIGRGRFGPEEMDVFGWMRLEFLLGRISDSVTNFATAFPEEWAVHERGGGNVGSALLECHIRPHRWPRAGDGFVVRSGLKSSGPKVRNLVHWVLNPSTGLPWWTMEGVAAPMDLDARRILDVPEATRKTLESACIEGLSS